MSWDREWKEIRTTGKLLASGFLLFVGVVALGSPEPNLPSFFLSIPLGVFTLAGGFHLLLGWFSDFRAWRLRLRLRLSPWTATLLTAAICSWAAVLIGTLKRSPAEITAIHGVIAVVFSGTVAKRDAVFDRVVASGVGSLWKVHISDQIDRASRSAEIAEPVSVATGNVKPWVFYPLCAAVAGLALGSFLMLAWAATGSEPPGRWMHRLVFAVPVVMASTAIFPFAAHQAARIRAMFDELRDRIGSARAGSEWSTYERFLGELYRDFGQFQGLAFKIFAYFSIGVVAMTAFFVFVRILTLGDSNADDLGLWERSPLGGVPITLSFGLVVWIAGSFIYSVVLVSYRALTSARWLLTLRSAFVLTVDEKHTDGHGGLASLGKYSLFMVIPPLVFGLWTSWALFAGTSNGDSVVNELADVSLFYLFELALLVAGSLVPLYLGHRIMVEARINRYEQLRWEIARTPESHRYKRDALDSRVILASSLPRWPIGLRQLETYTSAGAIFASFLMHLSAGSTSLLGSEEASLLALTGTTTLAVWVLLIGAGVPSRVMSAMRPADT